MGGDGKLAAIGDHAINITSDGSVYIQSANATGAEEVVSVNFSVPVNVVASQDVHLSSTDLSIMGMFVMI